MVIDSDLSRWIDNKDKNYLLFVKDFVHYLFLNYYDTFVSKKKLCQMIDFLHFCFLNDALMSVKVVFVGANILKNIFS